MRTFLETTHERYEKAVGDQFGITVHGMFSDEVGLLSPIPWSKLLPEEFENVTDILFLIVCRRCTMIRLRMP